MIDGHSCRSPYLIRILTCKHAERLYLHSTCFLGPFKSAHQQVSLILLNFLGDTCHGI